MAKKKESLNKKVSTMVVATNVSQTVGGLKKQSAPLFKIVENFTIKTPEDQAKLVKVLEEIKLYGEKAEHEQSLFVDPAKKIIAQSKVFFEPFIDSVEDAKALGKKKILEFVTARLIESKNVGAKFKAGKIKKVGTVVSKQDELETNDNTRNIWKLKITKPGLIPRKFLVPDETLIKEYIKKGKTVPGCKMVQEITIAI